VARKRDRRRQRAKVQARQPLPPHAHALPHLAHVLFVRPALFCLTKSAMFANAGEAGLDEEEGKGQWERAWAALMWTFGGGCVFSLVAAQVREHQATGLSVVQSLLFCSVLSSVVTRLPAHGQTSRGIMLLGVDR